MQSYYHLTKNENVEKILKEGLRSGADLGYKPPQYYDKVCDNNFIYLSKTPDSLNRWFANMDKSSKSLITLYFPEGHPIGRDLDTPVIVSGQGAVFGSLTLKDVLQEMGIDLSTKDLVQVSQDRTKIQELFVNVPNYTWDRVFGFYRTPINVPASSIVRFERCDQDFVLNQRDLIALIEDSFARVDIDDRTESVGKKIRNSAKEWVPYTLVVGEKEATSNDLQIRERGVKETYSDTKEKLVDKIHYQTKEMPYLPLPLPQKVSMRPLFK